MFQTFVWAAMLAFGTLSHGQDSLTNGLVAYYPFDGSPDAGLGLGPRGVVNGATLASDRFGNANLAYYFNGSSHIRIPHPNLPRGNRTVSLWFKKDVDAGNGPTLLAYGGDGGYNSFLIAIDAGPPCNGGGIDYIAGPHGPSHWLGYDDPNPRRTEWTHWVVTVNEGWLAFFLNGSPVVADNVAFPATGGAADQLFVGAAVSAAGDGPYSDPCVTFFKGWIDEVRLYNRVLATHEISQLFTREAGLPELLGPLGQQIPEGGRAVFRVDLHPEDPPLPLAFQWFRDGAPFRGAGTNELIIENMDADKEGTYQVQVSNSLGSIMSAEAQLALVSPGARVYPAVEIEFPSQVGKTYCVESSTDLIEWRTETAFCAIPGTGQYLSVLLPTRATQARYFRYRENNP